jgi:hypothetical protein
VQLVPNKRNGSSTIRVRTLKARGPNSPAGIPLNHAGIKFADQDKSEGFDEYKSIEIEFNSDEGKPNNLNAPRAQSILVLE